MPELIGGLVSIQRDINYPEMARRAGIEGKVYIQFIVNENGDVENPRVIRGIGGGADEEALRAVKKAKFKPGVQRGQPVRVQYSLPVVFRLNNSESSVDVDSEQSETQYKNMTTHVYFEGNILKGEVLDGKSGQPLSGANVVIEGSSVGSTTNSDGEFSITRENISGERLIISYVGYASTSINLDDPLSMD